MTAVKVALIVMSVVCAAGSGLSAAGAQAGQSRPALTGADIDAIARLLQIEDTRQFDAATLSSLLASPHAEVRRRAVITVGRVVHDQGLGLLDQRRTDSVPDIVATVAFAMGQLKNPAAVPWLTETMGRWQHNADAAFEAARALGKIRSPEAWTALAAFARTAPDTPAARVVIGEALLSLGRFTTREDLAPILRWTTNDDVEVRWRATWALFRPRNPAALPHLMRLTRDPSADVRFWAARGPAPAVVDELASPDLTRATASARLRELLADADRRVRTEALRTLMAYDDDASVTAVVAQLTSADSWMSVSAAETLGRHRDRIATIAPALAAAVAPTRPLALRVTALTPLSQLAPPVALDAAASLLDHPRSYVRNTAIQVLRRMGPLGLQRLEQAGVAAPAPAPAGAPPAGPAPAPRTPADYRAIVERWIVPAYAGAPRPRAVWMTDKGEIELELFAADAPLGMEEFVRLTEAGAIVGTPFSRLVPNFVAQQATIAGARRLRDEVNRHGLTRANLAWASSGLDTGRPGYTLGNTPQPHNEGDFTSLGRVVRGMDVVDRLELGDRVTAATIIR